MLGEAVVINILGIDFGCSTPSHQYDNKFEKAIPFAFKIPTIVPIARTTATNKAIPM